MGLANAGARKAAVVLDSDLATAQQIGNRRNGFLGVFRARAHGKDEVTQGKCAWLEDLIGLFHRVVRLFQQFGCQSDPLDASLPELQAGSLADPREHGAKQLTQVSDF